MLSQPESRIHFQQIMDEGQILLVNLAGPGSKIGQILGCFLLSLLHLTAIGRNALSADRRRLFHIYCDEAHRFDTDALEDIIAETRKYEVSLTLAHHYLKQFEAAKADAFASVSSTVVFSVDAQDAKHLLKDLQEEVKVIDLVRLGKGEAVARIGSRIVKIKTFKPREDVREDIRDRILQLSHERYCRPVEDVKREIDRKMRMQSESHLPGREKPKSKPARGFPYDEFS